MLARIAKTALGLVLIVIGALGAVLPVLPGWPLGIFGLALVLSQSRGGQRLLNRLRLRARDRFGSERTRKIERALPKEAVSMDTIAMRIDLEQHELARRDHRRRKRRRRSS